MKFVRHVLPVVLVGFLSGIGPMCAQEDNPQRSEGFSSVSESRERDDEVLREYIKSKMAIGVKEKGGRLTIGGDIRGEWDHMHAKTNKHYQRGWGSRKIYPNSLIQSRSVDRKKWKDDVAKNKKDEKTELDKKENASPKRQKAIKKEFSKKIRKDHRDYRSRRDVRLPPFAKNEFSVEVNLLFDYRAERAWGAIHLQFDNPAGIAQTDRKPIISDSRRIMFGSGVRNNITLKRAFAGYNVWKGDVGETARFDIEVGRRKMYDIFDSKIEFDSYFDGVLARYMNSFDGICDFSLKGGAFVIDSTVNHYGYVGEMGFLNIVESGIDFKYSLIDWEKRGRNRFGLRHPLGTRFLNSQFATAYTIPPELFGKKTKLYGGYLVNSKAKPVNWTHHKRANDAFYVGMTMGEIRKKGDWAFDLFYQWVQAQAIPENDVQDIGRDNPRKVSFYNRRSGGFANFKGWRLECFYALTDNWTLHPTFDRARQLSKTIGGRHSNSEVALEVIFAF